MGQMLRRPGTSETKVVVLLSSKKWMVCPLLSEVLGLPHCHCRALMCHVPGVPRIPRLAGLSLSLLRPTAEAIPALSLAAADLGPSHISLALL